MPFQPGDITVCERIRRLYAASVVSTDAQVAELAEELREVYRSTKRMNRRLDCVKNGEQVLSELHHQPHWWEHTLDIVRAKARGEPLPPPPELQLHRTRPTRIASRPDEGLLEP